MFTWKRWNLIGAIDTITKAYVRENKIFADAFNYLIYDGHPVINAENLHELDITEIALPTSIENTQDIKSHASVQQYRDILKSASIKTHKSVV